MAAAEEEEEEEEHSALSREEEGGEIRNRGDRGSLGRLGSCIVALSVISFHSQLYRCTLRLEGGTLLWRHISR